MGSGAGEDGLPERDELLGGHTRPHGTDIFFLVESWGGAEHHNVLEFLRTTEIFGGIPDEALRELIPLLEPVHVPAGEIVIHEGAPSNEVYVVGYGRLNVFQARGPAEVVIAEVGAGQVVGEAAILIDRPRTASVRAVRDSLLLRLSEGAFTSLAASHPDVLIRLSRQLLRRVLVHEGAAHVVDSAPHTVAIVPAGSRPVPAGFAETLAAAAGAFGSVALLTSGSVDRELAALGADASQISLDDARNGQVVEWLQKTERANRLVLYEGDATPTAWSRRCLRQADRVLLVADAASGAGVGAVERALLGAASRETVARCELVLLHAPGVERPAGTTSWLTPRTVASHHHVRIGDRSHHRKLARFLFGRAVGVVLGGGGARGAAHLGVLQAIDEAGIPIDAVAGTSIGSVVAAMAAIGWDHATRMRKLPVFFSTRVVIQPTLPLVSISSGRRASRMLQREAEGVAVEDLWTRYFSVSSNLSRAEPRIHDRGKLWLAIRASLSLPGILPPVSSDGDLLVDGGLLNNLPFDVMQRRLGGGRVIAVDLRKREELRLRTPLPPALSGWAALGRRLLGRNAKDEPPSIAAVMQRTIDLAGIMAERGLEGHPGVDLYLQPPVAAYGLFDFKAAPRMITDAYAYAVEELSKLPVKELFDAARG